MLALLSYRKRNQLMPKSARVHSDNVNSYGYRILTQGMDWTQFDTNPVMMYNHIRHTDSWEKTPLIFPIGKWNDRKFSGTDVILTPEFDEEDQYGKEVARKWENGYLNATSIHVRVVEISEDPALMLPGQTRPTITKCIVKEVSVVDIPGNAVCHKLSFDDGTVVMLGGDQDPDSLNSLLPLVSISNTKTSNTMTELKLVLAFLGMPENTELAALIGKLTEMKNENARLVAENARLSDDLKKVEVESAGDRVKALLDGAIESGKLTEVQRPIWTQLAENNFDGAKLALDAMQAYKAPTLQLDKGAGNSATDVERFLSLAKEGKLKNISKEEREQLTDAYAKHLRDKGRVKVSSN